MLDRRFLFAIVLPLAVLVLSGSTAHAWVPIGPVWANPTATYDTHTLSANWRGVADYGAGRWDLVTPSPWDWVSNTSSANDIYRGSIDGRNGTLAVTYVYYSGSTITRATMKFDTAELWYLGSGSPTGSQVDGRSVAAHEFGHATGIGHTTSQYCPAGSGKATMCPSYTLGTTYMRSLEVDDRNAINSLYP